jgi:predicted lipoprotein with Yx(FWY)xxD motif
MRLLLTALALAAVLALGACGSDDDSDSGNSGNGGRSATVELDGDVLVDSNGAALYVSEQEDDGKVRCTDACAEIWLPLTASDPTAGSDVTGRLGVVERPDGARQVTYEGQPVYRFADDSGPGDVSGDGLSDSFAGQQFTWHVIGEQPATSGSSGGGGTYSY